MNRANLGHTGEAVAAKYYIRQGYLLLVKLSGNSFARMAPIGAGHGQ